MSEYFPRHYEAWRKCIVEKCQIQLTSSYIEERLRALENQEDQDTIKFIEKYGQHWHKQIITYFKQARNSAN